VKNGASIKINVEGLEKVERLENIYKAKRRERIATAIIQGLLSNSSVKCSDDALIAQAAIIGCKVCIAFTDALIAELDREPKP